MTRRHYQLFALAILIGAPLLVSLLNQVLLGVGPLAPAPVEAPARPEYMNAPVDPSANLPQALTQPPSEAMQGGPQAGSASNPAPLLDPSGLAVSGSDPSAADPSMGGAAPSLDPNPAGTPGEESGPPPPDSEAGLIAARS